LNVLNIRYRSNNSPEEGGPIIHPPAILIREEQACNKMEKNCVFGLNSKHAPAAGFMDLLTRIEELLLLIIWKHRDEAYGYGIRARLSALTGSDVSIGSVHVPLRRLARRGYLESWTADPTPERGGRAKRFYRLTPKGVAALQQVRSVTRSAWQDTPEENFGLRLLPA
jgi:DNA-binding PadR family transcriptional regulator